MFFRRVIQSLMVLFCLFHLYTTPLRGETLAFVPAEIASSHFTVTIDGKPTPVMHAAVNLYFLNFEAGKRRKITITADTDDFWEKGVEVQPWRLGIRPTRSGRTISFTLDGQAKILISRPADYLTNAEMLYLFANPTEPKPLPTSSSHLRFYGPGAHYENIDAQTGDNIYLAPGAVIFGSLNVWGAENVKVFGRGVIVYDGPQNPSSDDGWMHKRNWHCIVMDKARNITIEGLTCVVRSRTWQIQMKDSHDIVFDNIKVIGANTGNANADGMDWLGGGDTIVRNSFFRAADDVFAMQSSWEGYGAEAFAAQGNPVTNVKIENVVVSTSISNIVRAGWPHKNYEGGNFSMVDSDVLHMGIGGCGIPFALMEVWADPKGRGRSSGYTFNNIRMEDWYSLMQLRQSPPGGVSDVHFTDVAGLELPSLVPSVVEGEVQNVTVDNLIQAGTVAADASQAQIISEGETAPAVVSNSGPAIQITTTSGLLQPKRKIAFKATAFEGFTYEWIFGDGAMAKGASVKHKFPDTGGTLLDGSGKFRVLLHVSTPNGRNSWLYVPIVIADRLEPAINPLPEAAGLKYSYSEGPGMPAQAGISDSVALSGILHRATNYSLNFTGNIAAPIDAGYVLTLVANDPASISIDGHLVGSTPSPFAQVCGLAGNAARPVSISVALAKGKHLLHITDSHTEGRDDLHLYWQAPNMPLSTVPATAFSH